MHEPLQFYWFRSAANFGIGWLIQIATLHANISLWISGANCWTKQMKDAFGNLQNKRAF